MVVYKNILTNKKNVSSQLLQTYIELWVMVQSMINVYVTFSSVKSEVRNVAAKSAADALEGILASSPSGMPTPTLVQSFSH